MSNKKGDNSSFWVSYGDLMTSLFFVMLVLVIGLLAWVQSLDQFAKKEEVYQATQKQIDKINELQKSTEDLDPKYFAYDDLYKKFVLNIEIKFPKESAYFGELSEETQNQLFEAGNILYSFISDKHKELGADYVLVIEGQASKDHYIYNNELSYQRALSLKNFWLNNGLDFSSIGGCELLVAGSGTGGVPRDTTDEENNQRFLVTLITKPGEIK